MANRHSNDKHELETVDKSRKETEPEYYVMKATDNVSTIVSKLKVSQEEFCKNNGLEHIGMVRFGRKYRIN